MKESALRFLKSILPQKKTLLGLAVLVPLLSISLVSFAYAVSPFDAVCMANPLCALSKAASALGIGNSIANAFVNAAGALLDGVVGTIAIVVKAIAETVASIMQEAIKFFIEIPTSPSNEKTPQAIKDGWVFSRNLVNIVFILILTFIGLATILRLQSYQLQKTLPSLIIVALLVNFSGVFVGFIVDIGNIIATVFINMGGAVKWSLSDIPLIPFGGGAAKLGTHIVEIVYYLISTLVYFMVVLLFGIRTLVLWMLVILAPLAFGAYILPATKKYWTQWLGQLIQWSILGIPISFMLMLAKKVMLAGPSGFGGFVDANSALYNFMAPFTAILFLFFGITLSMQLAPAGAQGIVNFAKKLPKRITETRLGAKAAAWGALKTQRVLSGTEPYLKNLEEKGGLFGKPLGWAGRRLGFGMAAQGANRLAGPKLLEYAASKRKVQISKEFDEMSPLEQTEYIKARGLDSRDKLQFAARMADKKTLKKTGKPFQDEIIQATQKEASNPHLQKEIDAVYETFPDRMTEKVMIDMELSTKITPGMTPAAKAAARTKIQTDINKIRDEISADMASDPALNIAINTELTAKGITLEDFAAATKLAREIKPQDVAKVADPKTLSFRLAMRDQNSAVLQRVYDNFGKDALDDIFIGVGGLNSLTDLELQNRNGRLRKFLTDTPAGRAMDWEPR